MAITSGGYSGSASGTACCRSSRCSTPTRGAPRTAGHGRGRRAHAGALPAGRAAGRIIERSDRPSRPGCPPSGTTCCATPGHEVDLSPRRITAGGAAVPRQLMEAFQERFGVDMVQGWGMTETSPPCARSPPRRVEAAPDEEMDWRAQTGRLVPGVETADLRRRRCRAPERRRGGGRVRGPWPVDHRVLLRRPAPDRFDDGWLRTGDIASVTTQRVPEDQ